MPSTPRTRAPRGSAPGRRAWPACSGARALAAIPSGGCSTPTTSEAMAIYRVDVARTGPRSPVPPGIPHLPGPGQFYASPALSRLLRATPAAELGDRFPGHQIGTIGPSALPAPDSLIIVIGHNPGQLSRVPGAGMVASIATTPGNNGPAGYDPTTLAAILAVGALALLFPVLVFIGTATRLAAARREQRFAAIRLAGGTPRQVSVMSAVEASIAALGGCGHRLHPLHPAPSGLAARVLHRRAVRLRRPVARSGRHLARRGRRPGRRGGGGADRAAARADLPARRHPAGHPARSPAPTG